MHILLVDDNDDANLALSFALRLEGHTVRIARNGTDGYALAQQAIPDVAILDLGMPGMNGFELALNLRYLAGGKRLLIVAHSGYGMPRYKAAAEAACFDLHLTKPAGLTQILEILCDYESGAQLPHASTTPSVHSRALLKAAEVIGGREKLCRRLRVDPSELQKWIDGNTVPPLSILQRAVDCILDETPPPEDSEDPNEPSPATPRDRSSASKADPTQ
jgi:CheY-like chemotaxis protein